LLCHKLYTLLITRKLILIANLHGPTLIHAYINPWIQIGS
jgi:hypothetical protein